MALLTVADYRQIVGDTASPDSFVTTALATGQQLLEEYLDRSLDQISRTETVRLHPDGRAYVRCMPLISVSDPPNAIIRDQAILGLWPQLDPQFDLLYQGFRDWGWEGPGWTDRTSPFATVTYVGGFTATTLPRKLRQAIADLARVELQTFDPAVAGVKSARVGDVQVQYAEPGDRAGIVAAILNSVKGFRRRELGY